MSIISKYISIFSIFAISLYSLSNPEDIIKFVKNNSVKNPMVKIISVNILKKSKLREPKGWEVYFLNIVIKVSKGKGEAKKITVPQIIFTDGNFITQSLINMKTGEVLEKKISLSLDDSVYNDKHLVIGNKNAKNKIVVFSDPQCFYCKRFVPEIFKVARANPEKIALYFYHFPLTNIHPVSTIIAKIMIFEQKLGNIDNIIKLYSLKIDAKETDINKILSKIEKDLHLKYDAKQILTKNIAEELEYDNRVSINFMISSTPTVYINGKKDQTRMKYKELVK